MLSRVAAVEARGDVTNDEDRTNGSIENGVVGAASIATRMVSGRSIMRKKALRNVDVAGIKWAVLQGDQRISKNS